MLLSSRRSVIWLLLLLFSSILHALLSWHVGKNIKLSPPPIPEPEIQIIIDQPAEVVEEKIDPPEEQLEFEEELELEPPEILIAPKTLTPPPPDVTLALRAQGSGFQGIDIPDGLGFVSVSKGHGVGGFKTGIGNGLGDGTARFAPYIANLREAGLDVVFCIDATGSMGWVIDEVKDRIEDIAQIVRSLVPIARFGFVAYRDYDGPEFTTRVQPLTYSSLKLNQYLSTLKAKGGGDWYEAIDAGLQVAINDSGWRTGARKIIILIGDAPLGDEKLNNVLHSVRQFQRSGGTVSTLDVSEQANPHLLEAKLGRKVPRNLYRNAPMHAFLVIGEAGQGDAATLDGDIVLTKRLIKLIMGDQFAAEMQALLDVL
jgi:hypothetical protein